MFANEYLDVKRFENSCIFSWVKIRACYNGPFFVNHQRKAEHSDPAAPDEMDMSIF